MEFQREPGRIYAMNGEKLVAEVTFPERDGVAVIDHTFVDDSLRGQGVAGQLVRAAVDQIRADGRKAEDLLLRSGLVPEPPGGAGPAGPQRRRRREK